MSNKYKKWIYFPKRYELVVGDTFELFYKGIVSCGDPERFNIKITCKKGAYFKRKYMFTPTEADVGEHMLTMEISDDYGDVLDTASVVLKVYPKAKSPNDDVYVLCMGASTTSAGQWPSECYRMLTANDGEPCGLGLKNIHFIGSKEGKYGSRHEGYGGWSFDIYNRNYTGCSYFKYIKCSHNKTDADRHSFYTDGERDWKIEEIEDGRLKLIGTFGGKLAESGVLRHSNGGVHHEDIVYDGVSEASGNPYWNEYTGRVDFGYYLQKLNVPRIDICVILLGWNSTGVPRDKYKAQVRTFIDNLRAEYPNCHVVLKSIQGPCQDGFGISYGCMWNYREKHEFVLNMYELYAEIASEYENVSVISTAGQFDVDNNYPTIERPVNVRSSVIEKVQSNGVHPTQNGYEQLGSIVFRHLNALLIDSFGDNSNGQ